MAIVIDSSDLDKVLSLAAHYNLEAIPVATVTNGKIPSEDRLVIRWKGKNIVDLKRSFLDQN